MRSSAWGVVLAIAFGCGGRREESAAPPPPPPTSVASDAGVVVPAAPQAVSGAPDLVVAPEKTSASGEVIRIGEPRLQLVPGWVGDLVVRVQI